MARVVVIGGGMSGLSLGFFLKDMSPGWEVQVLEAEDRPGGKAWTVEQHGYLVERGVNGVLDNKPSTLELAKLLGLSPLRSFDASRKRFVVLNGRLVKLPEGPGDFMKTPLLSPLGKLRVMAEYFVPRGDLSKDESLAQFAIRRLGKQAFMRLIDPMATGIYAGDPHKLSLRACFPRIYELERDYGGLLKAMMRLKKEAKKKGKDGPGAGPGGTLTSFPKGMSQLAQQVAKALGKGFRPGQRVRSIEPDRKGTGWLVHTQQGESIQCSHLVLACPAKQVSDLLRPLSKEAAGLLDRIYYPPVAVVAIGVKKDAVSRSLDGFGFLCPGSERRKILGCLWDSSIFSGRAPEGRALLRVLVGGARTPQIASLSDEELLHVVLKDLRDLMGLKGEPEFVSIYRWEEAIPQYNVGHLRLIDSLMDKTRSFERLYFRCNWLGGVSLNDCVANSEKLAQRIARG